MSLNDNALGTLKKAYAWLRDKQVAQPAAEIPSTANPPMAVAPATAPTSLAAAAGVPSPRLGGEANLLRHQKRHQKPYRIAN